MRLEQIVATQRDFFLTDETKSIDFRKKQLNQLAQAIEEYKPQIYEALKKDLNKSNYEAYLTEVSQAVNELRLATKQLQKWCKPTRVQASLASLPNASFTVPEPYGVTLILSPWNYPFLLTISPLIGAIAAGNCVVLKTSRSSYYTSQIIKRMLEDKFGSHYIYVIEDDTTYDTILEQKYDYIFFTGSPRVGRIVMRAASENLTPVCLELGGKSPCIVDKTADIQASARKIAWGKLINAGQTCVAPDFVLVEEEIKEDFVKALQEEIIALYGNPLTNSDYPKIINLHHYMRLCRLIDRESDKIGGERDEKALKIAPAIFPNATFQSEIMREEIFGPIFPIVSFMKMDAALEELKNRPNPLACYIFTKNKKFADKIIKEYSFGGGCVNDCIMHLANENLPFGGVGNSGMGSYHGYHTFKTFSHEKSILYNRGIFDLPLRFPPFTEKKWNRLRKLLGDK